MPLAHIILAAYWTGALTSLIWVFKKGNLNSEQSLLALGWPVTGFVLLVNKVIERVANKEYI